MRFMFPKKKAMQDLYAGVEGKVVRVYAARKTCKVRATIGGKPVSKDFGFASLKKKELQQEVFGTLESRYFFSMCTFWL